MLKKTFRRSRFSPDTLERVKMGVTLWGERYIITHTHTVQTSVEQPSAVRHFVGYFLG